MIISLNLRTLRNPAFITFTDGVISIGKRHNLTAFRLKPAFDAFDATLAPLNAQYAIERGSSLTEKIANADQRRDRAVVGIRETVEAHLYHFAPATVEAANLVKRVFDKYGTGIQTLPYNDQSGVLKSLAEDLQVAPTSASVTVLGLTAWVTELKNANQAFVELYGSRTTETSQKPSAKMIDLRQLTNDAYQSLVRKISAINELEPSPELAAYIAEMNAHIEPYLKPTGGKDEAEEN